MKHPTRYSGTYKNNWAGYYFKEPLGYTSGVHPGVDYNYGVGGQDYGQDVVAIADGVVKYAKDLSGIGFGKTVIIEHSFGVNGGTKSYSRYMHLLDWSVRVGQKVSEGQKIGRLGATGTKSAHLHLELWSNKNGLGVHTEYHKDASLDSYVDPYLFIQKYIKVRNMGESMVTDKDTKDYFRVYVGKPPTASELNYYRKRHWRRLVDNVFRVHMAREKDQINKANETIRLKNAEIKRLTDKLEEANKSILTLQEQVERLGMKPKATVIDVGEDTRSWVEKLINLFRR